MTPRPELLAVSASTHHELAEAVAAYRVLLRGDADGGSWRDTVRTACLRDLRLPVRMSLVARTRAEAAGYLDAAGPPRAGGVRLGTAEPGLRRRVLFVYSGLGSVWPGMGVDLLGEPVAARVLKRCADLVGDREGWSLLEQLTAGPGASRLHDPRVAQPALFAVQAALTRLWRYWGVEPDLVVGTSVGEIAAAHAAAVLTLEDGLRVAVRRGEAVASARGTGCMVTVGLPATTVEVLIDPAERLWPAVYLSPALTLVSGDRDDAAALGERVRQCGGQWQVRHRDYPLHSPLMRSARAALAAAVEGIAVHPPDRPVFSTLTGAPASSGAYGPDYWAETLVSPVRVQDAVLAAAEAAGGTVTAVEIGPRASMTPPVQATYAAHGVRAAVVPSMGVHRPARHTLLQAAAHLYVLGHDLHHHRLHR
ncbi:acyltransferase domain-containing protein [Saccharothrix syringae]|uniref:Acyltransferase domain-containing protein n=1 Tax=Saccharothrix syringae TaxID=103733 RepID=A0A5Q0H3M5_SACSY|nr:acyltransferase domain-containing protein [Saccharothrix syringae]QFZ20322.1 acyltransferase domain-containing protein [Saccharothrix syringae]